MANNKFKIFPGDPEWIEEISRHWETKYTTEFISQYKSGSITKDDLLKVAQKVAEYKNDNDIVDELKSLIGLK